HTRFSRDWSSDVCSSDLRGPVSNAQGHDHKGGKNQNRLCIHGRTFASTRSQSGSKRVLATWMYTPVNNQDTKISPTPYTMPLLTAPPLPRSWVRTPGQKMAVTINRPVSPRDGK